MQKDERQNALRAFISSNRISRQGELAEKLVGLGFNVTQTSVSRDLTELGVTKVSGFYSLPKEKSSDGGFGEFTVVTAGENLIVGRCGSGLASAITVRIDRAQIPEIVGTIAGDDTIFVAVKGLADQAVVMEKIREIVG